MYIHMYILQFGKTGNKKENISIKYQLSIVAIWDDLKLQNRYTCISKQVVWLILDWFLEFVYSPSLSDCSTIIDDDLDSELEFLASASSVMVNPVPPYTRDVLTQLAPLQMHFLSLFDAQCLIQCTLFRVSLHMHPLKIWGKIWWIWFDFRQWVWNKTLWKLNFGWEFR